MKRITAVTVFILLFVAAAAYAKEEEHISKAPDMLGAGVLISSSPYKGDSNSISPVPIINVEKGNFFIRIDQAGYSLYKKDPLEVYTFLQPRFMGYRSSDSDFLRGMKRRNWSVDAGLGAELQIPGLKESAVSVEVLQDILANSKGQEVDVFCWHLFDLKPLFLVPKAGLMWESKKVINYYYGVKDTEIALNRPAYSPNSSLSYRLGADSLLYVSKKWALATRVYVDFFGSQIKNSPIVDKDYSATFLCGVVYSF